MIIYKVKIGKTRNKKSLILLFIEFIVLLFRYTKMKYLSTILLVLSLNILVIIAILFYQSILIEYLIESLEFEEAKLARLENK